MRFMALKVAPFNKNLQEFEKDLLNIINIFQKKKSNFQKHLDKIIKSINDSDKILVKTDKTGKFYKMTADDYNK